jgi:hypothetical protein
MASFIVRPSVIWGITIGQFLDHQGGPACIIAGSYLESATVQRQPLSF